MKRFLLSVMAGALGSALLASGVAFAQVSTSLPPIHESNIAGTYISTFSLQMNDPASIGVFKVPVPSLNDVIHAIGNDVGKKDQCPTLVLPSGVSSAEIKAVAAGITFGPGDTVSGVMQITYDGAGSLIGEADFNIFKDAAFKETTSFQTFNSVNSGLTSRICGGPKAATMDPDRCGPVCTSTLSPQPAPPYNCALIYQGSNASNPNLGGGGYVTDLSVANKTTTPATPNSVGSLDVLHFYISALGLCGTDGSFSQCCNDPTLEMIMHIPMMNAPGPGTSATAPNVTQQFGVVGDPWASGSVNTVFSE